MKKNRKVTTWITREYTHVGMVMFLITKETELFPLTTEGQWVIDELEKIVDLHFVFTSDVCKEISPSKFTEVYQGSSYSITPDTTGIDGILGGIDYDRTFWPTKHLMYFLIPLNEVSAVDPVWISKLLESSGVRIQKSVFKTLRYGPKELLEFYRVPEETRGLRRFFVTDPAKHTNTYTTHTCVDPLMAIKPGLYEEISKFCKEHPLYQGSFEDYQDFFASVVYRLGVSEVLLNQNIADVKISTDRV